MDNNPHGTILRPSDIIRANNALVEEAVCFSNATGFLLISYHTPGANRNTSMQRVRLNVDRNTILLNSLGRTISLCSIRTGMRINAVFSARMTRSNPPQATAFLITTLRQKREESMVSTGRIAFVDTRNNTVTTGNPNNINDQVRYVVTDNTAILDRMDRPLTLRQLSPGQMVRITHANFQTASIPPQTTAFQIRLI